MPPYPKHHSVRARNNKTSTATELVVRDPNEVEIPPLPERIITRKVKDEYVSEPGDWHPMAVATWNEVWSSPMVAEFLEADYGGMRILLALECDFWEKLERGRGVTELAAEISRVRKNYGLAPMGRRSLQWTIAQTADVVSRAQRRITGGNSAPTIDSTVEEIPSLPEGESEELLKALE